MPRNYPYQEGRECRCGGEGWDGCRPVTVVRPRSLPIVPLDALRLEAAVASDEPRLYGLMGAMEEDRIELMLSGATHETPAVGMSPHLVILREEGIRERQSLRSRLS